MNIKIIGLGFLLVGCVGNLSNSSSSSNSTTDQSLSDSNSIAYSNIAKINIFSINDLHGAITADDHYGIAKFGKYIKDNSKSDEVNIKIANGDMFQGTALSYYSQGKAIVDILNELQFDEFTIGNHEFDWGTDYLREFQDGVLENGEANFPFLGANIYSTVSGELMDFVSEYTIVEQQGLKIGIIGVIGYGLENSIAASMLTGIEFKHQRDIVLGLTSELRINQGCDLVIVANHNGDTSDGRNFYENTQLLVSNPDQKIDVLINGHTHYPYVSYASNQNASVPIIQSAANGQYLGKITLSYDRSQKKVINSQAINIAEGSLSGSDSNILNIIHQEEDLINPIINRIIGTLGDNTSREMLAVWEANLLKAATGADIGMVNNGGIRSYNYYNNQEIMVSDVLRMMPFDNVVKTVLLTKQQVLQCRSQYDLATSMNLYYSGSTAYLNGNELVDGVQYKVSAIDYIFDKEENPFLSGSQIVLTTLLARELMLEEIELQTEAGSKWYPSHETVLLTNHL
ncbi:MAG: 5'-nucleotidase C-terminal domain-containing protein [Bacillales bacterium]|nr:5'-nucleotidase C-terminal domain-containing protein [Bacillales bacterium]